MKQILNMKWLYLATAVTLNQFASFLSEVSVINGKFQGKTDYRFIAAMESIVTYEMIVVKTANLQLCTYYILYLKLQF